MIATVAKATGARDVAAREANADARDDDLRQIVALRRLDVSGHVNRLQVLSQAIEREAERAVSDSACERYSARYSGTNANLGPSSESRANSSKLGHVDVRTEPQAPDRTRPHETSAHRHTGSPDSRRGVGEPPRDNVPRPYRRVLSYRRVYEAATSSLDDEVIRKHHGHLARRLVKQALGKLRQAYASAYSR